ncbi:MAG: BlaI/MecI/CopY family transcriptional regulator [Gracilibacteraceae bacterium]|nr:BlaI/MecI/CopY family transcriptional regulator [Gracilibacteraceae bacterium]
MDKYKLFDAEYRFITIIWEVEPINSTELVKICRDRLGWKKSTTYTVLKKLSERGVLQNVDTIVSTLVTHEQVQKYEGESLLNRAFDGSLPTLLATFLQDRKLSAGEAEELRRMIEDAKE